MTVEIATTIDAMGISRETGNLHLVIFANRPWSSVYIAALQAKINTYLGFIETGAICDAYPDAMGRTMLIDVYAHYRPDDEARLFFKEACAFLDNKHGIALRQMEIVDGYCD